MRTLTWTGFWLPAVLLYGMAVPPSMAEDEAKAFPILQIMSLDPKEYSLELSHSWGRLSANHVFFNDHRGPFNVVVEPSGKGVQVNFTGWSKDPFVASADKIRIIYQSVHGKKVEFTAETMPGGEIRIRVTDRPVMQGRRIAFRLGERDVEGIANLSIQGSKR